MLKHPNYPFTSYSHKTCSQFITFLSEVSGHLTLGTSVPPTTVISLLANAGPKIQNPMLQLNIGRQQPRNPTNP